MQLTPAIHLSCVLRECRVREFEFDKAWELAMRSLPRGRTDEQRTYLTDWKNALRWAKPNFRAAYAGQSFCRPLGRGNGALHELGGGQPDSAGRRRRINLG